MPPTVHSIHAKLGKVPVKCLDRHDPNTKQAVKFAGRVINLSLVAKETGFHVSYISRIFSGKRYPSLRNAERLAEALGMEWAAFRFHLDTIDYQPVQRRRSQVRRANRKTAVTA